MSNLLEYENRYYDLGYDYIIGLDEAGRGPMAGELVVAGVIFPKGFYDERIFDSKQLTAKKREAMYQIIIENALAYHIEVISVEDVDQLNVYSASQKGMEKCCQILKKEKMFALTDAMPLHDIEHLSIIKGDTLSMSIAAASILAKVTRDHLMIDYAKKYPQYGFEKHKGYVTKAHKEALSKYGPCPIQRKSLKALQAKEKVSQEERREAVAKVNSKYTTIISSDYPDALKEISCPPFVLFYHGNLNILNGKCIGVIGKRVPSEYGSNITDKIVCDLVKNEYTIVSGMALGIDTLAHRSALKNKGKTVAVLGSGINYCYPKRNQDLYAQLKSNHLIISEKPGDYVPQAKDFPSRNRLIAGLSESVVVTEAEKRSGTMITVGYALDQGKDIYCIPSRIGDPMGCNLLIQQGAKLVLTVNDIIED